MVCWSAALSAADPAELVRCAAPEARIVEVDATDWPEVLAQARSSLRRVEAQAAASAEGPGSVQIALEQVERDGVPYGVEILCSAHRAAGESPYLRPEHVTQAFEALGAYSRLWRADELPGGLTPAFAALGVDFAPYVSAFR